MPCVCVHSEVWTLPAYIGFIQFRIHCDVNGLCTVCLATLKAITSPVDKLSNFVYCIFPVSQLWLSGDLVPNIMMII